jgi:hypothetical protein
MKNLLTYGLLALALVGAGFAVKQRLAGPASLVESGQGSVAALPGEGVVVTYFTTDVRCPSCHKIEDLTRGTVESGFADKLASGELVFRTVNTDMPENRHFVDDYNLVSKTVIVSQRKDGREIGWKNLQDVWMKLSSPGDFEACVRGAIEESLEPSGT